jgi:hypothetical protein
MVGLDQIDMDNISQLVEAYDRSGGFKYSWKKICAYISYAQAITHNRSDVPCGDCGKMLPTNMDCDNPECVRYQVRNSKYLA